MPAMRGGRPPRDPNAALLALFGAGIIVLAVIVLLAALLP